ncbi:MAG: hypothetical protein KIT54_10285 [Phycisphaeraceae bacterium]|nr:hypothetical protein [Phycisphaeraceae bacterium]
METAAKQPKERMVQLLGQLRRLGPVEKMLVVCLVVILGMAFYLVSQYTGRTSQVPAMLIQDAADRARAMGFLRASGIAATTNHAGEVLVPAEQATMARALLMEEQVVPMQSATFFERLVEGRSWMNSRQDNHQQYWAIYSQVLSESLSSWRSLRQARVLIDMPEQSGLGRAHRAPTASVMVWPASGELPQATVDAIARSVAGAVSGLEPSGVQIADGSNGMVYVVQDQKRLDVRGALEQRAQVEAMIEGKLREFLRDIPGMSLAVLARVDSTRRTQQSQRYERPVTALVSESRTESSQQNTVQGGVGGTRSNESMTINPGSAGGTSLTETTEESAFEPRFSNTSEHTEDPGGHLQGVSVMLGVPRSYVRRLLELEASPAADGQDPASPTPQDIAARFERVRDEIEKRIQVVLGNIVKGDPADVAVTVSMLSDVATAGAAGGGFGIGGGSGGGGGPGVLGLPTGGLIDKALLAVLALVSVAMMALLVRKATRRDELPTAEELVGIPPALLADGDLFGEADEGDVPMSGIELDEEQVRASKMLEQVGELVSSAPETAANLLQSWIAASEE